MLVVLDVVSTQQRSGFAMRRLGYLPIYLPNPTYLAEARRSLQEYGRTSTPVTQTNRNNPFDVCLSDLLLEFTRRAPPAQCEYAASPLHRTPQPPHCPTSPLPHSVFAALFSVPCPPRPPLAVILVRPPPTPSPTQPRSTTPNHRRAQLVRHPAPPASAWSPLWPACCARAPDRSPQRASRPRAPARRWCWRGFSSPP